MSDLSTKQRADNEEEKKKEEEVNLEDALKFAIEVAQKAGQMILDGQHRRFTTGASSNEKLNSVDLVTEVDKAVEAFVTRAIQDRYPSHAFVGEETYDSSSQRFDDNAGPTWIVDPIDGTTNFIHGFPFVACSIGLAIGGRPVVGVIHNPFLGQTYSAARGKGAYLSSPMTHSGGGSAVKLPIASTHTLTSLGQALVGVEWGSARQKPEILVKSRAFETLAGDGSESAGENRVEGGKMVHSLRSVGSAALNICQVASGSMDVYWEIGCWAWDVCAGIIILEEAGGLAFGAKQRSLKAIDTGKADVVDAEVLQGRKYLFVRPMLGEGGKEAQLKLAKEFFEVVEEYDP